MSSTDVELEPEDQNPDGVKPGMTFGGYVQLLKLRIGVTIALTSVMGYAAVAETISIKQVILLVIAMFLGSASSSVFNHYYDRDIDLLMKRTANRPIASGAMGQPKQALWIAAALMIAGVGMAMFIFNWAVALHLFLGAFVYGVVYTVWLKRRTWVNIIIGGAAGSFAVLAGAAAVDPTIWLLPWLLALTLFFWTPSHFWSLAILLKEDYNQAGVPMLPCVVGDKKAAKYIFINSIMLIGSTLLPFALGELGWLYVIGAVAFGSHFLWLNWNLLKDPTHAWARRNFLGSMQYLVGIFLSVMLDKHLLLM